MNVLIVSENVDLGGAQTMAIELANGLNGVPDSKIAFASPDGILAERLEPGIAYIPISQYNLSNIFRLVNEFKSVLRTIQPDIIHPQGATMGMIAGIAAKLYRPKTKIVLTHHAIGFTRVPLGLARLVLNSLVDAFVAISKTEYNKYLADGFIREKVFLIPNFVDRSRLLSPTTPAIAGENRVRNGIKSEERVILGIGRLRKEKRFDAYIDSLTECALREPSIPLLGIILGDGPERNSLEKQIQQASLPNLRFIMAGFQADVAAYLKVADIFFFPSEHLEVLPMVLIEAIALGVPVVCSDIPGNNDIIENGVNGFLVDIEKRDYAAYILQLLKDEDLRKQLSANGTAKAVECYDKHRVVADILAIYRSLKQE